jgi:hypothetical protein
MYTDRFIIKVAAVVLGTVLLASSSALAQSPRGPRSSIRVTKPPSISVPRPSRSVNLPNVSRLGRGLSGVRPTAPHAGGGLSPGRSSVSLGDIVGGLQDAARNRDSGYYGRNNGYYDWPYGYGRHDDPGRSIADAYRDVGIANALVNLVGIIANSPLTNPQPQPYYQGQPQPYYQTQPQPAGHYERRQVLIKDGYYEDYQVWVPEYQDSRTREIVAGHYETHRRWVPPVYGYQDVWVPN